MIPINLAALSEISGLTSGGGDGRPVSPTSTDGRREVGRDGTADLLVDLFREGGAPAMMKLEKPIDRL